MDSRLDEVLSIMNELIIEHGLFPLIILFTKVLSIFDKYNN